MLPFHEERSFTVSFGAGRNFQNVMDDVTRWLCEYALQRSNGSKKDAADLLGISRGALYRYLKRTEVSRDNDTYD